MTRFRVTFLGCEASLTFACLTDLKALTRQRTSQVFHFNLRCKRSLWHFHKEFWTILREGWLNHHLNDQKNKDPGSCHLTVHFLQVSECRNPKFEHWNSYHLSGSISGGLEWERCFLFSDWKKSYFKSPNYLGGGWDIYTSCKAHILRTERGINHFCSCDFPGPQGLCISWISMPHTTKRQGVKPFGALPYL